MQSKPTWVTLLALNVRTKIDGKNDQIQLLVPGY